MSHTEPIEVDPRLLESDEKFKYDTTTQSLTDSIHEYIIENGRRYHTYYGLNKNVLPTDETEQDRLDLHHEIMLKMMGDELYKAPIGDEPERILDIGTGTGIWAIDMADKFPNTLVIGTDLSPIQPQWVPENCRFEVDDAELEWLYDPNSFDFIHVRNLAQSISDWPTLMSAIYRCTKPGGYVELAELGSDIKSDEYEVPDDNPVKIFSDKLNEATEKIGRPPVTESTLVKRLEDAGFVDIVRHKYKQPLGPWPKDENLKKIGAMALLASTTGFHAYGMACFTRILDLDVVEADRLCTEAVKHISDRMSHLYNPFHLAYGRKPE